MTNVANYRRDIQSLRGLAVLAVVLFHANESFFRDGYLGVDVFFVISGFVVTPLILRIFNVDTLGATRRLANLRTFYKRRFFRLAPAMATTLLFSVVAIFLFAPPQEHQRFARQGIATLLILGNLGAYRYSGDYFLENPNPLVHTWSLSVEEQIYILLPVFLMLILFKSRDPKKTTTLVLVLITLISLISFINPNILQPIYSRAGIQIASQFSFYSPIDRIWQFTLGGLCSLFCDQERKQASKFLVIMKLLSIFAVVIILFGPFQIYLIESSIVTCMITVTLIAFRSLDALPDFLTTKLEWLGNRSYSIYLVHMPLLYIAKYSPITLIGNDENRVFQSIIAVIASILLGSISYSKVENRYRHRGKSQANGLKTLSVAVVLTFVLPMTLFMMMDNGVRSKYWGWNRYITLPPMAGGLDPNCDRNSVLGPPCVYNQQIGAKKVLLIGDSHAAAISQAIVDSAATQKWSAIVWTHNGCPFVVKGGVKESISESCIEANKAVLNWIFKNEPDLVIVSQFIHANSSQVNLQRGLTRLKASGSSILLIENNPIFPDEKTFMVQRPFLLRPFSPPLKAFPESKMEFKDKKASEDLAQWARENGISTVNFWSVFCKNRICTRHSDAGWLYYDDDHLSVAGAALFIPFFERYLGTFDRDSNSG